MVEKIVYIVTVAFLIFWIAFSGVQTYRLDNTRQQLDAVRAELDNAENRQQQLAEITSRTGTLLSESVDTVAGIRRQITEIRKNYEEMENLLNSSGLDKCRNGDISDTEVK